jgi:hypothetical protein
MWYNSSMSIAKLDLLAVNTKGGSNAHPVAFCVWLRTRKAFGVPLIAGLTEADGKIVSYLKSLAKRVPGGRFIQGHGSHGAREVAVQTFGKGFRVTHTESHQLTANVNSWGPDHDFAGEGQDRHATLVRGVVKKNKITVISVHAPTGTRSGGDWTNTPGARQWRYYGRPKLKELIKQEEALGRQVFVIGDLNEVLTKVDNGTGEWAKRLGMHPYVTEVMWIIVGRGPFKVRKQSVLRRAPGCDHPHELKLRLRT